jgi:hypothetical protein
MQKFLADTEELFVRSVELHPPSAAHHSGPGRSDQRSNGVQTGQDMVIDLVVDNGTYYVDTAGELHAKQLERNNLSILMDSRVSDLWRCQIQWICCFIPVTNRSWGSLRSPLSCSFRFPCRSEQELSTAQAANFWRNI